MRLIVIGLVLAAVVCASWGRLSRESRSVGLTGDEGISLLAATCHQKEFVTT